MSTNAVALPAEILCTIFLQLSIQDPAQKRALGWIASSTHVCQKWRRTALGLPQLWADNVCALASDAATDCFLQRAQSAPLAFRPRYSDPYSYNSHFLTKHQLALAEKHLHRVKIFVQPLRRAKALPVSFANALETSPLLHLTTLHLNRWDSLTSKLFAAPFTLRAPVLRELYLDSVFPSTIDAPQLRVLKVTSYGRTWDRLQGVPAAAIHAALRGMPLLEELTLEDMAAPESDENPCNVEDAMRVSLPHLRQLSLSEDVHDFGYISGVSVPATADVSITDKCPDTEEDGSMPHAEAFAALEHIMRAPAYDTLVAYEKDFAEDAYLLIHLRSSTSKRSYGDDDATGASDAEDEDTDNDSDDEAGPSTTHTVAHNTPPSTNMPDFRFNTHVSLAMMENEVQLPDIVSLMAAHVDVEGIRFLDVSKIGNLYGARTLRPLFALYASVTTVQLRCEVVLEGVFSLHSNNSDEGAAGNGGIVMPALKHIILDGFSAGSGSLEGLEKAWRGVTSILAERSHAGHPIRFLTLANAKKISDTESDGGRRARNQAPRDVAALEECDARCMLLAKESVEKIFDARGKVPYYEEEGRISEFVRQL